MSRPQRSRLAHVSGRLAIVAATLPLIDGVRGVSGAHWWVVGAAAFALVAYLVPYLALPAVLLGWLASAPLAAAGAGVVALMRFLGWTDAQRTSDLDVAALQRAIDNLPPGLWVTARRHALTSVLGTDDLVRAAVATDAVRWADVAGELAHLRRSPEPPLPTSPVTLCVAEAALIAHRLRPNDIDIHLLAAVAVQVPMCSAWAWSADRGLPAPVALAGGPAAADETIVQSATAKVLTSPGGEALHRRMEWAYRRRRQGPPPVSLTEDQWAEIVGSRLAPENSQPSPVASSVAPTHGVMPSTAPPSSMPFHALSTGPGPDRIPSSGHGAATARPGSGAGTVPTPPASRAAPPSERVPRPPSREDRPPLAEKPGSVHGESAPSEFGDAHDIWDAPVGALLREAVVGMAARTLIGLGAAAGVLIVDGASGVFSWLSALLAGVTVLLATAAGPRWLLVALSAAGAAACSSLAGGSAATVRVALVVAVAVVLARVVLAGLSRLSMTSRVRPVRLLWVPGVLAVRPHWMAAERALLKERPDVAEHILSRLDTDETRSREVRALVVARRADIRLLDDRVEEASRLAERALALLPEGARNRYRVLATAGRVCLVAGDVDRARTLLERAVERRAVRRDPLVARAWAECSSDPGTAGRQRAMRSALAGTSVEEAAEIEIAAVGSARSGPLGVVPLAINRLEAAIDVLDTCLGDTADRPAAQRLSRTAARGRLMLGELHLRLQQPREAAGELNRAVGVLTEPADRAALATGRCLLGAAQVAMGWHGPARDNLAGGLADLETHRGQLHQGEARARLLGRHGEVYTRALDALVTLAHAGADVGAIASELLESLRRGALAMVLRERGGTLPPDVRAIARRIQERERVGAPPTEILRLREELEAATNAGFAAAYVPRPADHHELHRAAAGAHTLSFRLHDCSERGVGGHLVWTPPRGRPQISSIVVEEHDLLEVLGLHGEEQREAALRQRQTGGEPERWTRLAEALLPAPLRRELCVRPEHDPAHLVIVPDGVLAYLPWAALRGDDGRVLATTAVTQLTPSLDLLLTDTVVSTPSRHRRPEVAQHLADDVEFAADERERLGRLAELRPLNSVDELSDHDTDGALDGAYLAAHGMGEGFAQEIRLPEGALSSGAALAVRWPPWVVFSSCLVGRVTTRPGREPLGLVVSCLISGAHTVLGGVLEAHSGRLAEMGPYVAAGLLAGQHPARALRDAQCRELARNSRPPAVHRWAGLSCISVVPPTT